MMEMWRYMDHGYEVDTEDIGSYRDLVMSMLDYDDCYDDLVEYLGENIGNSADLVTKMMWEGADYVLDRLIGGFVDWMLEDEEKVKKLVRCNCTPLVEVIE